MKKIVLIITCLLLIALCFTACKSERTVKFNEELILNGTFDGENPTEGWTFSSHSDDSATKVKFIDTSKGLDGDSAADLGKSYIKMADVSKYANYRTTVAIEKNSTYRLSAKIRIDADLSVSSDDKDSGLNGAFIAIASDYNIVSQIRSKKTNGWETVEVCFNSGDRDSVVVAFGIGAADADGKGTDRFASGTACFDGVSLMKIEPTGTIFAADLADSETDTTFNADYRTEKHGKIFMILTIVLGALCLYAAYAAFRTLLARKDAFLTPESAATPVSFFKSSAFVLLICELVAFALRLIVVKFVNGGTTLVDGYVPDAQNLVTMGAAKYYGTETVLTPIGSLYLLWMMGALASPLKLGIGSAGFAIFAKIPAILADLVIVFLIYYLANRKYNHYISAIFAGVYAIIPTFFFLSAGWGTYAPIGALFILLSLVAIVDKKYVMSIVYMAIALLFSTEALLLIPLHLAYLGFVFFKNDDYKVGISIALTSSIIGLYLISIPFIVNRFTTGQPFIVLTNYCKAFMAHTGFTENAFTIYGFFGLGAKAANTASRVFSWILVILMMSYTITVFFKTRSRLDLILLSAFTFVFTFVMTSAVDTLLIYPALLLLLAYGLMAGDRRVMKIFGGLTVTTLVNTSYAMTIGGYFGKEEALVMMAAGDPVLIIFSIANFLLLAYFAYVTFSICVKEDVKGAVIIEGNYFKYVYEQMKKCGKAIATFCTVTVPSLFKKEKSEEEGDAR